MYNNEDNDYMNNNSDNNSRNYENVEPDNNQSTGTTGYTTYSHNTGYNQNSAGGAGMNNGQNQYLTEVIIMAIMVMDIIRVV